MTTLNGWAAFVGPETVKCECGKSFCEVAPNCTIKVRVRPQFRAVGERHFSFRCRECKRELDMLVDFV